MTEDDQKNKRSDEGVENETPDLRYEKLNMSFWVINKSPARFTLEDCHLDWGKWPLSPVAIPANSAKMLAFRSCGKAHIASGTQGWVKYSSDQQKAKMTVKWDIPWSGDGYLHVTCEGDGCGTYKFDIQNYDPGSDDPNPILTITEV